MSEQPSVDVIIPVFNGQDTIVAALKSVLEGQGGWVRRIIVVDDGSDDDSVAIIRKLSSPLVEIICTTNHGVARARNLAIESTQAEWVAFLDADDVWMPEKLSAQISVANQFNCGFICGAVDETSVMPTAPISCKMLMRGNFIATSSVLVRRDILLQIIPAFNEAMNFAEDYLTWLKCLSLTNGYYISLQMAHYDISDLPRYKFGEVLCGFGRLNYAYLSFLKKAEMGGFKMIRMVLVVYIASVLSIASILKRFIKSSRYYC